MGDSTYVSGPPVKGQLSGARYSRCMIDTACGANPPYSSSRPILADVDSSSCPKVQTTIRAPPEDAGATTLAFLASLKRPRTIGLPRQLHVPIFRPRHKEVIRDMRTVVNKVLWVGDA